MAFPFLISCCSIALRDQPIESAARSIAEAGFSGIEAWYPHVEKLEREELSELKILCGSLKLEIPVLAPYFSFTRGRERLEESLRTAGRALEISHALGVNKIRTFIDCGNDGTSSARANEDQWAAACRGLKNLCRLDPATQFVVETHENTLADSLPSVCRLLEEVAETNLRLNFQSNRDFLQRGFLSCLESLYLAVSHMHWEQIGPNDSSTYLEEEGLIDFAALIAFLQAKEYSGTASVEYCWTPVEEGRIASAHNYLQGLVGAPLKSPAPILIS